MYITHADFFAVKGNGRGVAPAARSSAAQSLRSGKLFLHEPFVDERGLDDHAGGGKARDTT